MREMKATNTKQYINISILLLIYIIYIIFLSITDILALPLFYLDRNQYLNIVIVIALVITLVLTFSIKKNILLTREHFTKVSFCFLSVLFLIAVFRSVIPDLSNDVIMARVYWQYPGFEDNIDYNVFPAGFTFFFCISR